MDKRQLQLQQMNTKMLYLKQLQLIAVPPTGWIKAIRIALGMSAQQLGNKLSITRQGVQDLENREKEGAITLKALREAGKAMDLQLVYGFVPLDGSLEELIERKAREMAREIVSRANATMKLEDQENSQQRIEKAIEERTIALKNEMPKSLWD